jgi:exodeoxyribonuclease V alpha subunit
MIRLKADQVVKIRGIVERIIYQYPEHGYTILKVNVKGYDDLVTVVGGLLDANVGSVLLIDVDWKIDT